MSDKKKNIVWYLKTAGEALLWTAGYYGTELLQLFPEHTVANKVALPVGFALGFILRKAMGARNEYQKKSEQLPSGIKSTMDKMSNKITGVKDSKR